MPFCRIVNKNMSGGNIFSEEPALTRSLLPWHWWEVDSTSKRLRYYQSPEWFALRMEVRARSGGWCEQCGWPAQQCHHLTYRRLYHERLTDLKDLCRECHQRAHGRGSGMSLFWWLALVFIIEWVLWGVRW